MGGKKQIIEVGKSILWVYEDELRGRGEERREKFRNTDFT